MMNSNAPANEEEKQMFGLHRYFTIALMVLFNLYLSNAVLAGVVLKGPSGNMVACFGDSGTLFLSGTLIESANTIIDDPNTEDWICENGSGDIVVRLVLSDGADQGKMYIAGTIKFAPLEYSTEDVIFMLQNASGDPTVSIDETGNIFLANSLWVQPPSAPLPIAADPSNPDFSLFPSAASSCLLTIAGTFEERTPYWGILKLGGTVEVEGVLPTAIDQDSLVVTSVKKYYREQFATFENEYEENASPSGSGWATVMNKALIWTDDSEYVSYKYSNITFDLSNAEIQAKINLKVVPAPNDRAWIDLGIGDPSPGYSPEFPMGTDGWSMQIVQADIGLNINVSSQYVSWANGYQYFSLIYPFKTGYEYTATIAHETATYQPEEGGPIYPDYDYVAEIGIVDTNDVSTPVFDGNASGAYGQNYYLSISDLDHMLGYHNYAFPIELTLSDDAGFNGPYGVDRDGETAMTGTAMFYIGEVGWIDEAPTYSKNADDAGLEDCANYFLRQGGDTDELDLYYSIDPYLQNITNVEIQVYDGYDYYSWDQGGWYYTLPGAKDGGGAFLKGDKIHVKLDLLDCFGSGILPDGNNEFNEFGDAGFYKIKLIVEFNDSRFPAYPYYDTLIETPLYDANDRDDGWQCPPKGLILNDLSLKHRPVVYIHPQEFAGPSDVSLVMNASGLYKYTTPYESDPDNDTKVDHTPETLFEHLKDNNTEEYYLDFVRQRQIYFGRESYSSGIVDKGFLYSYQNGFDYGWAPLQTVFWSNSGITPPWEKGINLGSNSQWEMKVPNGSGISLTVACGGDRPNTHINTINVEGQEFLDAITTPSPWDSPEPSITQKNDPISIEDGKITLDNGNALAGATSLIYMKITPSDNTYMLRSPEDAQFNPDHKRAMYTYGVVDASSNIFLQYWHYETVSYSDLMDSEIADLNMMHAGDWEMCQVAVKPYSRIPRTDKGWKSEWIRGHSMCASQHYQGQTIQWRRLDKDDYDSSHRYQDFVEHDDSEYFRPNIYIAAKSHATYFSGGFGEGQTTALFRYGPFYGADGLPYQSVILATVAPLACDDFVSKSKRYGRYRLKTLHTTDQSNPEDTVLIAKKKEEGYLIAMWKGVWGLPIDPNADFCRGPYYRTAGIKDDPEADPDAEDPIFMMRNPREFNNYFLKNIVLGRSSIPQSDPCYID